MKRLKFFMIFILILNQRIWNFKVVSDPLYRDLFLHKEVTGGKFRKLSVYSHHNEPNHLLNMVVIIIAIYLMFNAPLWVMILVSIPIFYMLTHIVTGVDTIKYKRKLISLGNYKKDLSFKELLRKQEPERIRAIINDVHKFFENFDKRDKLDRKKLKKYSKLYISKRIKLNKRELQNKVNTIANSLFSREKQIRKILNSLK